MVVISTSVAREDHVNVGLPSYQVGFVIGMIKTEKNLYYWSRDPVEIMSSLPAS